MTVKGWHWRVGAMALIAALAFCGGPGAAAADSDGPLGIVKGLLAKAKSVVLGEGTRNEKIESLRSVASLLLDTRSMGRNAIGPVLAEQPPEQQEEFLELFDEVVLRAYLQKLLFFSDPRFAFANPRINDDDAVVYTKILTENDEFFVDYAMHRKGGGEWVATDVVIEGISLIGNYRDQFSSLLEHRSFEELLELMRRKRPSYAAG